MLGWLLYKKMEDIIKPEVNSAPGFEAIENYCGLGIAGEIIRFIQDRSRCKSK